MKIKDIATIIFAKIVSKLVHLTPYQLTISLVYYQHKFIIDSFSSIDLIRLKSLELVAQEIKDNGLQGSVAELGVYKGDFAKYINQIFPEKKLYLFDTFEGFDEKDIKIERLKGFSDGKQNFADTSTQLVLSKMKYEQNIIFKKGYFPDSAKGLEDTFCFVSIDVDLYEPIYNGLNWFSKRMNKGGYIFIHDYNNRFYPGTKDAIIRFCTENNKSYLPLCDAGGSAIIPF